MELPFFTALLTALAVENAVFTRALGLDKSVLYLNTPKQGIIYGGLFTWIATASSFLIALVNFLLAGNPYTSFIRAPLYFVSICAVWIGTHLLTKHFWRPVYDRIHRQLPFATFNSALFGAFYVSANQAFTLDRTVGYALGTGIGYTAAILIIYYARKRLAVSPVPRAFRGLPILLLYIGMLSLALYGLIGHALPT